MKPPASGRDRVEPPRQGDAVKESDEHGDHNLGDRSDGQPAQQQMTRENAEPSQRACEAEPTPGSFTSRAPMKTRTLLAFVTTFGGDPAGVEEFECVADDVRASRDDVLLVEALAACGQARMFRGQPGLARAHAEAMLQAARRAGCPSNVASGLAGLGSAKLAQGDYRAAEGHLHESLDLATADDDSDKEVVVQTWLAELAQRWGDHDQARTGFEACLERAGVMGGPYPLALSLVGLAQALLEDGDAEGARPRFNEAAAVARGASIPHVAALALAGGGKAALALGDLAGGRDLLDEAPTLARPGCDTVAEALALEGGAELSNPEGDLSEAGPCCCQALALHAGVGDPAAIARSVEALTRFTSEGSAVVAARLLEAADSLRRRHGRASLISHPQKERPLDEIHRQGAGQEPVGAECRISEAMSAEPAVDCDENERGRWVSRPPSRWDALTEAERRVAERAACGRTNAEIAREFGVADATVKAHLRRVFSKLGVQTRASLAAEVHGVRNDDH